MDPALYYKIYREGINERVILKYIKYAETHYLYNLIKNYVRRAQPKIKN